MISLALRQINYMLEEKSLSYVARSTGMSLNSLRQFTKKDSKLPQTVKTSITNAYNRESYGRLRDIGFSVEQARVYGRKIPEIASAWEANMRMKIASLTEVHVARRLVRDDIPATQKNIDKYFDIIYTQVLKGIKNSRVSPEDWLDY
jgi:hypothetical protein